MTNIAFNVPGIIKGKGRPRFVRSTGRAYTPQATLSGEQWVKHCALQAGIKPLEGAIALEIAMHLPVPRSWTRKRRQEALGGF
ncbi:MAG TPA: RusA family crossover junction endodeoxyribonuclease, partial [Acidocella sp.]|nr:RusA family crossover junction endodeoxyribonuclease [Acidocella sp.]